MYFNYDDKNRWNNSLFKLMRKELVMDIHKKIRLIKFFNKQCEILQRMYKNISI